MIRRLLPVILVDPGDSVSDSFVSFLDFPQLFSSMVEGNSQRLIPTSLGKIPLTFSYKNTVLSANSADKRLRIMYVCGMVAADFSSWDSSWVDGQPRFLTSTLHYQDYITITYVLDSKGLEP